MIHLAPEQDKPSFVLAGRDYAGQALPLGLYIHVPFCASTCDFCAFYQVKPTPGAIDRYLEGVGRELELVRRPRTLTSVFWGGGTPGLLSPKDLKRLGALVRSWTLEAAAEWTVEMAPASVSPAKLDALLEMGVTRVSLGVQSLDESRLIALGRPHSAEQARKAYAMIRGAGFRSVNIDLMFALPGQSPVDWETDLDAAVALQPDHISTYCLTLEEDTALWLRLSKGRVRPDAEAEARFYAAGWSRLGTAGYGQYEISNFALTGHACVHNLNTWRMREWIGLGPSAASQFEGWRGANVADIDRWLAGIGESRRADQDRVAVTPRLKSEDALIFGLRMNEGVDLGALKAADPGAPWNAVEERVDRMVEEGFAVRDGTRVLLTLRGRLVADSIGGEIMEAFST